MDEDQECGTPIVDLGTPLGHTPVSGLPVPSPHLIYVLISGPSRCSVNAERINSG